MTGPVDDTPDDDPSMDDILASIRRIMLDEQARLQDGPGPLTHVADRAPAANATPDPVLILDSSMVVEGEHGDSFKILRAAEPVRLLPPAQTAMPPAPSAAEKAGDAKHAFLAGGPSASAAPADAGPETFAQTKVLGATGAAPVSLEPSPQQLVFSAQAIEALMAPAAAAAAAASVDALIKQLSEERLAVLRPQSPPASPASPTLEDVVRAELRPFLKAWLDEHMPPMVERLVRAEITRLIGRTGV
jgi:cell pole-organizing protein PopZ